MAKNVVSQILKSAGIKGRMARQIGQAIEDALSPAEEGEGLDTFFLEIPVRVLCRIAQKGNVNVLPDQSDLAGQIKEYVRQIDEEEIDPEGFTTADLEDEDELDLDDLQEATWKVLKG